MRRSRIASTVAALLAVTVLPTYAATLQAPAATAALPRHRHPVASTPLPLGPANLPETRTTETLQPGVTLTRIVRGEPDASLSWTVEMSVPSGSDSPDPDAPPATLKDQQSARDLVARLKADGFDARAEKVGTPALADFGGGTLGWRVRVGRFDSQASANAALARLRDAGYRGSSVYTGWDGAPTDRGPWHVDVLRIDPKTFHGRLDASYGPDLERRETTSAMAAAAGAVAGTNAGFFVLDPKAGAPGDPAGVGVYGGTLFSEPVNGRPALVVRDDARHTSIVRLSWRGRVVAPGGATLALDGIDRVPTKIRNCGGDSDDVPTSAPRQDVTCTDPDEVVAFTPQYGASTPTGDGVEAVLDAHGVVVDVRSPRGGPLPADGSSVQATGTMAAKLAALAHVGTRLRVVTRLVDRHGRPVRPSPKVSILNGGPELVRDGHVHATPATDGMVHPGDPSWYYGWVHKRNPRTIAGVDNAGCTVVITADGRSTRSLGLSIREAADVAHALGLREAMNLDGGGSTTMVADGTLVNDPSDSTGERPVGDALLVLPDARDRSSSR